MHSLSSREYKFSSWSSSHRTSSSVPFILFAHTTFYTPTTYSSEMLFQAVLIHCPSNVSDGFLMFSAGVHGQLPVAATCHTGDIVYLWMFCWLPHQEPVSERSLSDFWIHLKPAFLISSKQYQAFCPRLLSAIQLWIILSSTLLHYNSNFTFFQNIFFFKITNGISITIIFSLSLPVVFYVLILILLHQLQRKVVHQKRWISSCVTHLS